MENFAIFVGIAIGGFILNACRDRKKVRPEASESPLVLTRRDRELLDHLHKMIAGGS